MFGVMVVWKKPNSWAERRRPGTGRFSMYETEDHRVGPKKAPNKANSAESKRCSHYALNVTHSCLPISNEPNFRPVVPY